jgi:mRNA-degrading endonuclease RelE of RelBE toxin-antitoxin system
MDKIAKALQKLLPKESNQIKNILLKLKNGSFDGLDIKKLKNSNDIFRVRKGSLRIIFKQNSDQQINVLTIERRSDKTYSDF